MHLYLQWASRELELRVFPHRHKPFYKSVALDTALAKLSFGLITDSHVAAGVEKLGCIHFALSYN